MRVDQKGQTGPIPVAGAGRIQARQVQGRFNRWRQGVALCSQVVFFGLCWLQWPIAEGGRQAVWFDFSGQKFHLFAWVFWPQDALLLAWLLIMSATGLFWVTALYGRVFCGFACPQTIYTGIFAWLEQWVEGDHRARRKLDAAPWWPEKWLRRGAKHGLWLLFSLLTGITFVGYFSPIRDWWPRLLAAEAGPWELFWCLFYAAFTYVLAGLAKESVCQHMCPYARFQGVMCDPATLSVTYDAGRGEPRRRLAEGAGGDCVDCALCVQVCPVGIDIRAGSQNPCINCGLCIDACAPVMQSLNRPANLIRFARPQAKPRWRPRVWLYGGLTLLFAALCVWTISQQPSLSVDVLRDRGALWREGEAGRIENVYTLRVANRQEQAATYRVTVAGLPGLQVLGAQEWSQAAGTVLSLPLTLSVPPAAAISGSHPITVSVQWLPEGPQARTEGRFVLP